MRSDFRQEIIEIVKFKRDEQKVGSSEYELKKKLEHLSELHCNLQKQYEDQTQRDEAEIRQAQAENARLNTVIQQKQAELDTKQQQKDQEIASLNNQHQISHNKLNDTINSKINGKCLLN